MGRWDQWPKHVESINLSVDELLMRGRKRINEVLHRLCSLSIAIVFCNPHGAAATAALARIFTMHSTPALPVTSSCYIFRPPIAGPYRAYVPGVATRRQPAAVR